MTRVLIRALTPLFAAGLEQMIASDPGFTVVRERGERRDELPDVILAEVDPAEDQAWDVPLDTSEGGAAVVLLADDPSRQWIAEALAAGVRGILPRSITRDELAAAVRAASEGLIVFHPGDMQSLLLLRPAGGGSPALPAEPLTPREKIVLQTMGEGLSNKEIALRLGISEHTVKFHVAAVMGKLGATSRTEAVMIAVRSGMLMV